MEQWCWPLNIVESMWQNGTEVGKFYLLQVVDPGMQVAILNKTTDIKILDISFFAVCMIGQNQL